MSLMQAASSGRGKSYARTIPNPRHTDVRKALRTTTSINSQPEKDRAEVEKPAQSMAARFIHGVRKAVSAAAASASGDDSAEDFDCNFVRYVPESVEALCKVTHYNREEIKVIYRGFKQECPTGIVSAEKFRELYGQFFPLADSRQYANLVFGTLDSDMDGSINFEEFIVAMSLLSRGALDDKLRWIFKLYNLKGDGFITPQEMVSVMSSVYDMIGRHTQPNLGMSCFTDHVKRVFMKLDLDGDGKISHSEFMEACHKDPKLIKSLQGTFDTVL